MTNLTVSSTKTYTHAQGMSVCFRQWGADSHCSKLHGYAIRVSLEFVSSSFDKNGWVLDFGACKPIKEWLEATFDHKTVVAADDPNLLWFKVGRKLGTCDLTILPRVGMEAFATHIYNWVDNWLAENYKERVWLEAVHVDEHESNRVTVKAKHEIEVQAPEIHAVQTEIVIFPDGPKEVQVREYHRIDEYLIGSSKSPTSSRMVPVFDIPDYKIEETIDGKYYAFKIPMEPR